ncbi:MAG: penicillin-binding protein 2 [bacterium]|nr:penicillin-binding protein 2 [bacterium]
MSDIFSPFIDKSIKDKKISSSYKGQVVADVDIPNKTETPEFLSDAITHNRVRGLLYVFAFGLAVLLFRVSYLQIAMGADYRDIADGNRIRINYLSASRGIIYDKNGEQLVKNIPNFIITITPSNLPKSKDLYNETLQQTANILEMSVADLEKQVSEHAEKLYAQPLVLEEFLPYEKALTFSTRVSNLPGVEVEVQASREYIYSEELSHVMGYIGKVGESDIEKIDDGDYLLSDMIGKNGLEDIYENPLKGKKGKKQVEVNALGNEIEVIAREDPLPGSNLDLSIDVALQKSLYDALAETSRDIGSPGGAAVAINPKNGEILALVSFPGYDLNSFIKGINNEDYQTLINDERKPLFNKAVMGEYPSGSTFKLVVAAAALEEGVVDANTTVLSNGGVQINKWFFPDWKSGGHGQTDVRKALAESVNTYFYLAGGGVYNEETREIEGGLGIDKINEYASKFGLSDITGIDLPAEAAGFLPTKEWKETVKGEPWYIGDTYNTSIGQGDVLVTPLQVALFTSVIANGGTLYKPRLVDQIKSQAGDVDYLIESEVKNSGFINSYNVQLVREGMRQAVTSGSAKRMNSLSVAVAGKTGTAQVGGTDKTHSWFTSFAPYDDPEIVLTVLVEEGGEGTESALPIAVRVLEEYFSNKP